MPENAWLGTTSLATTASNWSLAAVPVNGDSLVFDGRGNANDCDFTGFTWTAKAFPSVKLFPTFFKTVGSSGAPLAPANGITTLVDRSSGQGKLWVDCAVTTATIDRPNLVADAVNLDSSALTFLNVVSGSTLLNTGLVFAAAARIATSGPNAVLTIPSGVTYGDTANLLTCEGGLMLVNAASATLHVRAGTAILGSGGGTATLTRLELSAGRFGWGTTGTITEAHCRGGTFVPNLPTDFNNPVVIGDLVKTLTSGYAYDGSTIDLSHATNLTVTNGWRPMGTNIRWIFPEGSKITVAMP